jgi:hypothetical protein
MRCHDWRQVVDFRLFPHILRESGLSAVHIRLIRDCQELLRDVHQPVIQEEAIEELFTATGRVYTRFVAVMPETENTMTIHLTTCLVRQVLWLGPTRFTDQYAVER